MVQKRVVSMVRYTSYLAMDNCETIEIYLLYKFIKNLQILTVLPGRLYVDQDILNLSLRLRWKAYQDIFGLSLRSRLRLRNDPLASRFARGYIMTNIL